MTKLLKKYWWILLLLLVLPIAVNLCYFIPALNAVFEGPKAWTTFWGTYIGILISSLIAFYVLYKQLEQNQKENNTNRQLQLAILEYQVRSQWLTELKIKLADYYKAFSLKDVRDLGDLILIDNPSSASIIKKQIHNNIKTIFERMEAADFLKGLMFPIHLDKKESELLLCYQEYTNELYSLLEDLDWFAFSVCYFNGSFSMNKDIYIRETNKYLTEQGLHSSKSRKIGEIIKEYKYNIFDNKKEIIRKRMAESLVLLNPADIQRKIANLIDYEQRKIEKLLEGEVYGTK